MTPMRWCTEEKAEPPSHWTGRSAAPEAKDEIPAGRWQYFHSEDVRLQLLCLHLLTITESSVARVCKIETLSGMTATYEYGQTLGGDGGNERRCQRNRWLEWHISSFGGGVFPVLPSLATDRCASPASVISHRIPLTVSTEASRTAG